jgi:hypothetical protein
LTGTLARTGLQHITDSDRYGLLPVGEKENMVHPTWIIANSEELFYASPQREG